MNVIGYENGKDILKMSREDRKQKAKRFSEGNENLYEILMYLWDSGIETISCCIGHYDEECDRIPHLAVVYNRKSMSFFNTLLCSMNKIFTGTERLQIYNRDGKIMFSIDDFVDVNCEELFTKINVIKNQSFSKHQYFSCINHLLLYYKNFDTSMWFIFTSNSDELYITNNTDYPFYSNIETIDDLINHLKIEQNLKRGRFSCDLRSLRLLKSTLCNNIKLNKLSSYRVKLRSKNALIKKTKKKIISNFKTQSSLNKKNDADK